MTINPDILNPRLVTSLKQVKGKLNGWHEEWQIQPPKQPADEPLPAVLFMQIFSGCDIKIWEERVKTNIFIH